MPSAIVATVGDASANSYVTLAEAETYFGDRPNSPAWIAADDDTKTLALFAAILRLEQEDYRGRKAATTQALAWPRAYVYDKDGAAYATDAIPLHVQRAQLELAYAILAGEVTLAETGMEGFTSLSVGGMSLTPRHRSGGLLPATVRRELRGLVRGGQFWARITRS